MPYPTANTFSAREPHAMPSGAGNYFKLAAPVTLVTFVGGRETYHNSRHLFARIFSLPETGNYIRQVRQGDEVLEESSVDALNAFLYYERGREFFVRASRKRPGPESAYGTKWNWRFLSDYLGWKWRRA